MIYMLSNQVGFCIIVYHQIHRWISAGEYWLLLDQALRPWHNLQISEKDQKQFRRKIKYSFEERKKTFHSNAWLRIQDAKICVHSPNLHVWNNFCLARKPTLKVIICDFCFCKKIHFKTKREIMWLSFVLQEQLDYVTVLMFRKLTLKVRLCDRLLLALRGRQTSSPGARNQSWDQIQILYIL